MAIMNIHHPLAFTFGILGNIISLMVFLAPLPTFARIYKKKSTEGFQSLPYLVALFSCMLWLYYALLKKDALLLVTINSFGCVIETIYITIYLAYATKQSKVSTIKQLLLMNVGSLSFIVMFTQFVVRSSMRVEVLGWICVAISVSVFAAPLSIMAQVVRTRSVEFMPLGLSFFLTLSAVMWFSYGLLMKDLCIALPNVLGFSLGLLQMVLYAVYKNAKMDIAEEKKVTGELKTVVILNPLANSDQVPSVVVDVLHLEVNGGFEPKEQTVLALEDEHKPNETEV